MAPPLRHATAPAAHAFVLAVAIALAGAVVLGGPGPVRAQEATADVAPDAEAVADVPRVPVGVTASIEPRTATVGDQLTFTVTLTRPPDLQIPFPRVADSVAPFEVRDSLILPPEEIEGGVVETRHYLLAAFETGTLSVPGLAFDYVDADGDTVALATDTLYVVIESVLPDTIPAEEIGPRDIKPPIEFPRRIWPFLVVAATVAAAVLAAYFLRKWWRSRRRQPAEEVEEEPPVPRRAAHVLALERLAELRRDDPIGRGEIPGFYVRVTEILRLYIRDRFSVGAIDMTTSELVPAMWDAAIAAEDVDWTKKTLSHADLTKFAKYLPEAARAREDLDEVEAFVERTRFREAEAETSAPETVALADRDGGDDGGDRSEERDGSTDKDEEAGDVPVR
jgi:hypothetical protein